MRDAQDLPKTVDPFRYAAHNRRLSGVLPVSAMPRLLPDLLSDKSQVEVELEFGTDESIGVPWVKGRVKTCLELQCQRCLGSFCYDIIAGFLLGLVRKVDQTDRLPSRYDPLVLSENVLILNDIIEDELIINLPVVPKHPPEMCKVKIPSDERPAEKVKNPFEAIGVLRENSKKSR